MHLEGEKHVPVLNCSHQSHYFKSLKLESSEFSVVQNMLIAVFVFEQYTVQGLSCSVHHLIDCEPVYHSNGYTTTFSLVRYLHLMHYPEIAMCESLSLCGGLHGKDFRGHNSDKPVMLLHYKKNVIWISPNILQLYFI